MMLHAAFHHDMLECLLQEGGYSLVNLKPMTLPSMGTLNLGALQRPSVWSCFSTGAMPPC